MYADGVMLFAENPNDLQRGQLEEAMRIIYLKFERTIVTQKAKKQKKSMNFYFLIECITFYQGGVTWNPDRWGKWMKEYSGAQMLTEMQRK